MGNDRIALRGLRVFGRHGVLPAEREQGQTFVVDVDLEVSLVAAARSDDLADTVNYADVADVVVGIVGGEPRDLIEFVVSDIAHEVLNRFDVDAVTVTLHKPDAPIPHPFDDVAVTVTRRR